MNRWLRMASAATAGNAVGIAVPSHRAARDVAEARRSALALLSSLAVPLALVLIALVPRLSLGHSLDLVTDEGVYIPVGRMDYSLLISGQITSGHWLANYEAPALPKLLIGWGSFWGATLEPGQGWLFGARLPGIVLSALFLAIAYPLARPIFGKLPSALGLLALALSPWVAYFSAIAYLDTYMLAFATLAVLLTWHAARRPNLFPLVGALLALGFASKYTAALALLPIAGYLVYYYSCVARCRPPTTLLVVPVVVLSTVYLVDPAIWSDPLGRLWSSIMFEYQHAASGHSAFWAGQVDQHVPMGLAFYILLAKMSLFVTIPALLTLPWAAWQLLRAGRHPALLEDRAAFALCWLGGLLAPFALLNIVVGTHYMLPLAPATAFVGVWSFCRFGRWAAPHTAQLIDRARAYTATRWDLGIGIRSGKLFATQRNVRVLAVGFMLVIILLLIAPPLYGLVAVPQAEGYTSEWLSGEDHSLQVAYPAYADAVQWVADHSKGEVTVTLVSLGGGLDYWMQVRPQMFPKRVHLQVGTPWMVPRAQYVVWPTHLVQRQFPTIHGWQRDIATTIRGGGTTYCYILRLRTATDGGV